MLYDLKKYFLIRVTYADIDNDHLEKSAGVWNFRFSESIRDCINTVKALGADSSDILDAILDLFYYVDSTSIELEDRIIWISHEYEILPVGYSDGGSEI